MMKRRRLKYLRDIRVLAALAKRPFKEYKAHVPETIELS